MNHLYQIPDYYFGSDYTFFLQTMFPFVVGSISAITYTLLFGFLTGVGISAAAWAVKHFYTQYINEQLEKCPAPHREISNFLAWEEGDKIEFDFEINGVETWYFHGVSDSGALVLATNSSLEYASKVIMISPNAVDCLGMNNTEIGHSEITPEQAQKAVENSEYMEFLEDVNREYQRLQSSDSPSLSEYSTSQPSKVNT